MLDYLSSENIISEKSAVIGNALRLIRNSFAHSKTGSIKEYTVSFVMDAAKDIIIELLGIQSG